MKTPSERTEEIEVSYIFFSFMLAILDCLKMINTPQTGTIYSPSFSIFEYCFFSKTLGGSKGYMNDFVGPIYERLLMFK